MPRRIDSTTRRIAAGLLLEPSAKHRRAVAACLETIADTRGPIDVTFTQDGPGIPIAVARDAFLLSGLTFG